MNVQNYQNLIRKEKQHLKRLKRMAYIPGAQMMIANANFNIGHYQRMIDNKLTPVKDLYSLKGIFTSNYKI